MRSSGRLQRSKTLRHATTSQRPSPRVERSDVHSHMIPRPRMARMQGTETSVASTSPKRGANSAVIAPSPAPTSSSRSGLTAGPPPVLWPCLLAFECTAPSSGDMIISRSWPACSASMTYMLLFAITTRKSQTADENNDILRSTDGVHSGHLYIPRTALASVLERKAPATTERLMGDSPCRPQQPTAAGHHRSCGVSATASTWSMRGCTCYRAKHGGGERVWRIRPQELERPLSGGELHKRRSELRAEPLEVTRVRQRRTVAQRLQALLVVDEVLPSAYLVQFLCMRAAVAYEHKRHHGHKKMSVWSAPYMHTTSTELLCAAALTQAFGMVVAGSLLPPRISMVLYRECALGERNGMSTVKSIQPALALSSVHA